MAEYFHDVPPDVVAEAYARGDRHQSGTPMGKPWPLAAWPDVPTRFLLCRDDRFFPAEFLRRVVRDRLGITPDEMAGGHLPALAHPDELVERLEAYRTAMVTPPRA
jgi:pimeloyl-ACP methyl ester carboxylesterase